MARLRASARLAEAHVLDDHSGGASDVPLAHRPAVMAVVAGRNSVSAAWSPEESVFTRTRLPGAAPAAAGKTPRQAVFWVPWGTTCLTFQPASALVAVNGAGPTGPLWTTSLNPESQSCP